jgi:hypothetical protein
MKSTGGLLVYSYCATIYYDYLENNEKQILLPYGTGIIAEYLNLTAL